MKVTTINVQFKVGNVAMMEVELTKEEGKLLYEGLQNYGNTVNEEYNKLFDMRCIGLLKPTGELMQQIFELKDKLKDLDI